MSYSSVWLTNSHAVGLWLLQMRRKVRRSGKAKRGKKKKKKKKKKEEEKRSTANSLFHFVTLLLL